ncbi:MAG: UDP-N-acetylmuramoyl-tripeptide--D-alanyl-D-alanine ligase [Clostridia bacterium]|nr:UDP-N-acetylmuramoyl-tripeptide--D-alanyl-D-alanine ligase [Clostridia bacterium]
MTAQWILWLQRAVLALGTLHAIVGSLYLVHMLQLNGYHNKGYFSWCGQHAAKWLPLSRFAALLPLLVIGLTPLLPFHIRGRLGVLLLAVAVLGLLISGLGALPKHAKKPLVYTRRVWRLLITYSILLAAALVAARFAGGWASPARVAVTVFVLLLLVPLLVPLANFINLPLEHAIARHFVRDAERILRARPDLTIIGITGSYGKTSTKNFLHALLSTQYNVLMTPESYNTTMGVVRTIRERLKPSHEVFIVEMGAKGVGEIREICDIVHPKYGLLTSIGEQHLESFRSVENIIKTKFELADAIPADGFICVNADNEYIRNHPVTNTRAVTYGALPDSQADYRATGVTVGQTGSQFTLVEPDGTQTEFSTKLLGAHNIQNLVGCLALARQLGVPAIKLVYPVRLLKPVRHRLELLPNGFIDDAFNSNPAGFRSALDVLKGFDGQRVLVTPGMVELGEREAALNEELGAYAANCCDLAVLVGESRRARSKKDCFSPGLTRATFLWRTASMRGLPISAPCRRTARGRCCLKTICRTTTINLYFTAGGRNGGKQDEGSRHFRRQQCGARGVGHLGTAGL